MRLPLLYQRQNGFLAVLAATISFAGCQDAVPVDDYDPDASLHPTNPGTKDGATSDRFIIILPDVSAQVPDLAPPPGPMRLLPVAVCGDGILNAPRASSATMAISIRLTAAARPACWIKAGSADARPALREHDGLA